MITTKLRIALTAAALCGAAGLTEAKPRRVVVLDFDGPRALADNGRNAVVALLTDEYDIVQKKTWEDARSRASKNAYGPQTWNKAAKASGVDAVIEGWVQDEGRHKVLNVVVREASTGREFDTLTFKFKKQMLTEDTLDLVRTGLADVLDYIEPGLEPSKKRLPEIERRPLQGKEENQQGIEEVEETKTGRKGKSKRKKVEVEETEEPVEETTEETEEKTEVAAAPTSEEQRERNDLVNYLGTQTDEWPLPKKPNHVPQPTPRFSIGAGGFYASRSLTVESEDPQEMLGVTTKGLSFTGAVYPFPVKKTDGQLSGVGFHVSLRKAPASTVTVQGDDEVIDYNIDSGGWNAGVHYRYPLGEIVHIDGHAGYGQEYFTLESDAEIDVPDTHYKYFWAGANLDLNITDRASVGFGAKYLYITGNGDMSSIDWYGPGAASGYELDGNFQIPLPKKLFVRGEINYQNISTSFDAPDLAAEEARSADDGTVRGTAHIGIQF